MEVVVLQAGKEDGALKQVITTVQKVLGELQIQVNHIQLGKVPYYTGYKEPIVREILDSIEKSCGVVMVSRVELLSASGSLCTFFEHCSEYRGEEVFQKPLFAITASDWRGEREVAEYVLQAWDTLGGIEFGKVGIYTPSYYSDKEKMLAHIERMTEDFYRAIKQTRVRVKSSDQSMFLQSKDDGFAPILAQSIVKEARNNRGADIIRDTQEKDIEHIASLFKKQLYQEESPDLEVDQKMTTYAKPAPLPQFKTVQNMLKSLPHYFQAQYAVEFQAVIQYNLLGDDPFEGYISIQNGSCTFQEGLYSGAEIELTAPEEVFRDIFIKRSTSQKAFMLGQLKVRGNFMLLSKIDQMFKMM